MTPVSAGQMWLAKPAAEKRLSIRYHSRKLWNRLFPGCPVPLKIDPGIWWIARNDAVSDELWTGTFEPNERAFLRRFLAPGMVVVDVGAHAGFYSVLASKLVGASGRVLAFEPSARERRRLMRHLSLNGCGNVTVEGVALSEAEGEGQLLVFEGRSTGCNSFHLDDTRGTRPVTVPLRTLDGYVHRGQLPRVDLVKMDIEGAERSALRGAQAMFKTARPVLLCELHEKRVAPWGYQARDIIDLVASWGYDWFNIDAGGRLVALDTTRSSFFENGVAVPAERRI